MKINLQKLAYLTNLTTFVFIMLLLLSSFNVPLHTTHHMMALLSKLIATTSEMGKTELVLHPDHYFWLLAFTIRD